MNKQSKQTLKKKERKKKQRNKKGNQVDLLSGIVGLEALKRCIRSAFETSLLL